MNFKEHVSSLLNIKEDTNNKSVTLNFTDDQWNKIEEAAKANNVSVPIFIKFAIKGTIYRLNNEE